MAEFSNVTVVKKANVYFDGRAVSRTIKFADGSIKTLGFLQVGDYTFNTADAEIMEFFSGTLTAEVEGKSLSISGEGRFEIPANSSFTMHVTAPADYCCSFIKK